MFFKGCIRKIPREIYIYMAWGLLVGVVNIGSAWFFINKCDIAPVRANFLSWILYNMVSFLTNRKTVFHSAVSSVGGFFKELLSFYLSRVFTFFVESILVYIFIDRLGLWVIGVKVVTSVIVIFLNYYISKKVVFKKLKKML